jgi:hypothetical protein
MAATSGSFNAALSPDLSKEVVSFVVAIPAGGGTITTVTPTVKTQAVTVFNPTPNLIRATVIFSAGVVAAGAAATRTFLVPTGATFSADFSDHDGDNAIGAVDAIAGISFTAVAPGAATAESSTLTAATAAVAGLIFANFLSA